MNKVPLTTYLSPVIYRTLALLMLLMLLYFLMCYLSLLALDGQTPTPGWIQDANPTP